MDTAKPRKRSTADGASFFSIGDDMRAEIAKRAKVTADSKAHSSVVGGSTAKLRRACPKSIDEERNFPRETSIWADTGTALHEIMEEAIGRDLSFKDVQREFTGVVIRKDDMAHDIEITAEMLENKVRPALEYFESVVPVSARFWLERKMSLKGYIPDGFGTSDVVFSGAKRNGIIDWKFGDGWIIKAEDNDQMRFYLCAAILCGLLPDNLPEYEAHIFQPAEKLSPDEYGSKGVYTADDLWSFLDDLTDAVELWRAGNAKHNPGPHCATCKGKIGCPAYKQMVTTTTASDVAGTSTHDLARYLDLLPSIEAWVKDVKAAALRNALDGRSVPGYRLEPALGNRTWKDAASAAGALARLGLPAKERVVTTVVSAPQALQKLKAIGTPPKEIERFEKRHVIRPDNGERLVKAKPGEDTGNALERLGTALAARGL